MMDEEKFESKKGDKVKAKFVARTVQEAHRIKLEKLMSDPVSIRTSSLPVELVFISFYIDRQSR